jgi:hypothetical protein
LVFNGLINYAYFVGKPIVSAKIGASKMSDCGFSTNFSTAVCIAAVSRAIGKEAQGVANRFA